MPTNWTTAKPTKLGKYEMRDEVFEWGPIEVFVTKSLGGLLMVAPASEAMAKVVLTFMPDWIEWRFVG